MQDQPTLHVGEWCLRSLHAADAEAWLAIVTDPSVRAMTSWSIDTLDQMRAVIAGNLEAHRSGTGRRWAIVDATARFCGTCGFKEWKQGARAAELVYEIDPRCRGRGAMTEIAGAVATHGFSVMGLVTVDALVMTENAASIRVLEKLAFTRTATLPGLRPCNGVVRDFHRYERHAPP